MMIERHKKNQGQRREETSRVEQRFSFQVTQQKNRSGLFIDKL